MGESNARPQAVPGQAERQRDDDHLNDNRAQSQVAENLL